MSDLTAAMLWWVIWLAGAAAIWPLALKLCPYGGYGFTFAKVLWPGLLVISFIWLSVPRLVPFRAPYMWLVLIVLAALSWSVRPLRRDALAVLKEKWKSLLAFELFFLACFAVGLFMRGQMPGLDTLEKMMNIGFLNSLNRTDFLPAADMWFAGESINYYYGGHIAAAIPLKLTGITPAVAYNLALATLFALTAVLSFQLGSALLQPPLVETANRRLRFLSGTSASLLVTLGSNGHPAIYDPESPLAFIGHALTRRWPDIAGTMERYWFPSSTRFIGYNPSLPDKTIHEFPSYSFLVADLHAHLINLVFVLAFLLFLLNAFARAQKASRDIGVRFAVRSVMTDPLLMVSSVFLSFFQISNYWDFIMYFALLACVLLFLPGNSNQAKFVTVKALPVFFLQALPVLAVFLFVRSPLIAVSLYLVSAFASLAAAAVTRTRLTTAGAAASFVFALSHVWSLPFNLHFEPIGKTIRLTESRTSLYQFLIVWGLMLLLAAISLIACHVTSRSKTSLFLLIAAGFGLVFLLVPELVYVVDIYGGEFKRANTMFKFTYQAFVLLMLVIGAGPALLLSARKKRITAAVTIILSLTFLWFPLRAVPQWFGQISLQHYRGLDGTGPLRVKQSNQIHQFDDRTLSDYFAVIDWLNVHEKGQPALAEAYGPSYTDHALVSAFTGLPTVMGWETHEWLWRTTSDTPEAYRTEILPRQLALDRLYTSGNKEIMDEVIQTYGIAYIVIGPFEQQTFSMSADDPVWAEIGNVAFAEGDVTLIRVH